MDGSTGPQRTGGAPPTGGEGQRSVLVVDDNPALREMVCDLLDGGGYEVAGAAHGQAALDLVEGFRPDVIILDSAMPVMDGTEFARRYRLLPPPHAPILLVTGEADGLSRARAIGAAYLGKPFCPATLLRLVATAGHAYPLDAA